MGKLSRTKGKTYEREIANALKPRFPDARRSYGQSRTGGDAPDVLGTPWWVECTHGKRVNVTGKYAQGVEAAATSADPSYTGRRVVVFSRVDRQEDLVTLSLEHFLELLK